MQTPPSTPASPASLAAHPEPAEWMDYLYAELPALRREKLDQHLAACPACALQVQAWRGSLAALDQWRAPERAAATNSPSVNGVAAPEAAPGAQRVWVKWAAAAAVMLCAGFALGRRGTVPPGDFAALKLDVTRLSETVEREHRLATSNTVALVTSLAADETTRWLREYSQAAGAQTDSRTEALRAAVETLTVRLARLQAELETVAVNTADGFQQTHQNLARLAAYQPPTGGKATFDFDKPQNP